MNLKIIGAINRKQTLSFTYDNFHLVVEPHAYGVAEGGTEVIQAYQTKGRRAPGDSHPWHLFSVSKLTRLSNTGNYFAGPRPDYERADKAIRPIYHQL